MMLKLLLVPAALVAVFLGYIALQSRNYVISREIVIALPPEKIFPFISQPKLVHEWSPWLEQDPGLQMVYSGPSDGIGAKSSWDSRGKMGTGSATVIESVLNQRVQTQLDYTKPFEMSQVAEIVLKPTSGGTMVTWSVQGKSGFMARVMCSFMSMDKMVGDQFVKGLNTLKSRIEAKK